MKQQMIVRKRPTISSRLYEFDATEKPLQSKTDKKAS